VKKNLFLRHFFGWAIWLNVISALPFIWSAINGVKLPAVPTLYNYASLIAVYYASYFFASQYYKKHSGNFGTLLNAVSTYVFSWRIIWPLLITVLFIFCCWYIDGIFATKGIIPGREDDLILYAEAKFSREVFYVTIPIAHAAYHCLVAAYEKTIQVSDEVNEINLAESARLEKVYMEQIERLQELLRKKTGSATK
jgi:hypothetical protein